MALGRPRERGIVEREATRRKIIGRVPTTTRLTLYLDLIRWNRPAGWLLLLWPTLSALWVASQIGRAHV